tara:strand:+ start:3409 stop:5142 length:1734 start_codon:yes stop_codon:yes gene_type:complete
MPKILKLFSPGQRKTFFILLFFIIIASILEMLSLAIIVPIINLFLEIETSAKESNIAWITNLIGFKDFSISSILLFFIIFFSFKTIFSIFVSWKHHSFIYQFIDKISFNLYSKYLSQDYQKSSLKNSSELMRNILREIEVFSLYLLSFIQIILESVILIGIFIFLLYLLTIPTLMVIFFSSFTAIIYYLLVKKNLLVWGKDRQKIEKDRIIYMQEAFSSIKEINVFNRNNFFLDRFKEKNRDFFKINTNFYFLNSIPRNIFELFTVVIILFIFIYLVFTGSANQDIIKVIALFLAASFRIIPSVYRIFNSLQNLKYSTASFNVLYDDFKNLSVKEKPKNGQGLNFKKNITLEIKKFNYDGENSFQIKDISLEIFKNQKIGIIGKSGSGKSTLIDILAGILKDSVIKLKVDNKLIETEFDRFYWQKKIGLIPQNISIMNETLKENILFGLDKDQFPDEKIIDAIKLSNLTSLLTKLPNGLEYIIKERGLNFSGGEIQRIGIARALIFNPEILIFDEATSALDTFTENEILKDINLLKDKTIIMISHRMNSLRYCDKIFLIDNGEIKDEGSFEKFNKIY